jgi:hypothetical protein
MAKFQITYFTYEPADVVFKAKQVCLADGLNQDLQSRTSYFRNRKAHAELILVVLRQFRQVSFIEINCEDRLRVKILVHNLLRDISCHKKARM